MQLNIRALNTAQHEALQLVWCQSCVWRKDYFEGLVSPKTPKAVWHLKADTAPNKRGCLHLLLSQESARSGFRILLPGPVPGAGIRANCHGLLIYSISLKPRAGKWLKPTTAGKERYSNREVRQQNSGPRSPINKRHSPQKQR